MNVFGFDSISAVMRKVPCRARPRRISSLFWELTANPKRRIMVMSRLLDDHSLVQACRAGQTEAFGILVARYQERLYPTIFRLIGSAEDAEDVLQDTFVCAFEKLDQFQGDSSFYTWIYRIAVNLALSGYRRRRVRSPLRLKWERIGRPRVKIRPTSRPKPTRPSRSSGRNARELSKTPLINSAQNIARSSF